MYAVIDANAWNRGLARICLPGTAFWGVRTTTVYTSVPRSASLWRAIPLWWRHSVSLCPSPAVPRSLSEVSLFVERSLKRGDPNFYDSFRCPKHSLHCGISTDIEIHAGDRGCNLSLMAHTRLYNGARGTIPDLALHAVSLQAWLRITKATTVWGGKSRALIHDFKSSKSCSNTRKDCYKPLSNTPNKVQN